MDLSREIFPYLLAWIPALGYFLWRYLKRPETSVGLIPVFLFNMWMYYWIAGLSHYFAAGGARERRQGTGRDRGMHDRLIYVRYRRFDIQQTAGEIRRLALATRARNSRSQPSRSVRYQRICLPTGARAHHGRLPGLNALTAVGGGLVMVGLVIGAWKAWFMGGRRALYRWLGICAMMPLVTVVGSGFLGAGSLTLITVIIFITRFFRPRWILVAGFFIGAFIGMSVDATYTRDKTEIRGMIWGRAGLSDRVERILLTVSTIEWFTPAISLISNISTTV